MAVKMIALKCNQKPLGEVTSRQPKQPGQKKAEWNIVKTTIAPVTKTWGNICKDGNVRCTNCGQKGHEEY